MSGSRLSTTNHYGPEHLSLDSITARYERSQETSKERRMAALREQALRERRRKRLFRIATIGIVVIVGVLVYVLAA